MVALDWHEAQPDVKPIIALNLGSIHSHFVHSISNSTVNHFAIDSINALTYLLYWLFDDKISPYLTSNIIQCRIHRIFVIKQLVQKVSALIESVSK